MISYAQSLPAEQTANKLHFLILVSFNSCFSPQVQDALWIYIASAYSNQGHRKLDIWGSVVECAEKAAQTSSYSFPVSIGVVHTGVSTPFVHLPWHESRGLMNVSLEHMHFLLFNLQVLAWVSSTCYIYQINFLPGSHLLLLFLIPMPL